MDEMDMNLGHHKPLPFVASGLFLFPDLSLFIDKVGFIIFNETPGFGLTVFFWEKHRI
jgi:hypothetical protein